MPTSPPSHPPPDDLDGIDGVVDDVAAAFADFLPAEALESAREFALDAFAAQPVARLLAERLRPREAGDASGERPADDALPQDDLTAGKASGDDR